MRKRALLLVLPLLAAGCSLMQAPEPAPPEEEKPRAAGSERIPRLAVSGGGPQTVEEAYRIQRKAVAGHLGGQSPAGFKAGLTSDSAQRRFGVAEPVAGVLWPGGRVVAEGEVAHITLGDFGKAMLELELAFRVSAPIDQPMADIRELRRHIDLVYPALELPDLGFEQSGELTGADIVAANVAASRYVLGPGQPAAEVDINAAFAELEKNGVIIQRADAIAVMQNQWRALHWLVNRSIANGWRLEPGQVLFTGAMGEMVPLEPGYYVADYGELGRIELEVVP